jgi:[ribosomal protein S5]-alanine N-acetyltransferase
MGEGLILETDRLLLRKFTLNDVDALEKVIGDPVAMEYYPAPFSRRQVEEWIIRNMRRYEKDGCGLWAMAVRSSGELIGDCGCGVQQVEGVSEMEVAYHTRRDLWGNGFATEAAHACMDYAFNKLGVRRVISMIRPENYRSRRVAEKNGMLPEKVVFWHGYDHCIYARQRN